MALFVNYFFTCLCTIYAFCSIIEYKFTNKTISFIFISIFSTYITTYLECSATARMIISFSLIFTVLLFLKKNTLLKSATLALISYGISLISFILSGIVVGLTSGTIYLLLHYHYYNYPYYLSSILVGLMQMIIIIYLLNIPRFKKGILYLANSNHYLFSIIFIIIFALYITLISKHKDIFTHQMRLSASTLLLISSFFLLYYWRHRIKQAYIETMRRMDALTYENTIADRDKEIQKLKEENAELGKIVHKYRKIIPAMELSVLELFQSGDGLSHDSLKERAQALQIQLAEMREEPDNLLAQYQKERIVATQTGLHTVDAMISLMEKRAKQEGIRYKVQTEPNIRELALHSVKESDLLHLLGDLLENSIHAVSTTVTKELLIHFGSLNDCLLLEVFDSGTAFDIQTYQHLGNEPFTSHQSDGGSGTGLMDIWKIKKAHKASLYIYEYQSDNMVYTKKISFLFDGKNHFLLKTYRDKEIRNSLIRGDLHVFPHQTE